MNQQTTNMTDVLGVDGDLFGELEEQDPRPGLSRLSQARSGSVESDSEDSASASASAPAAEKRRRGKRKPKHNGYRQEENNASEGEVEKPPEKRARVDLSFSDVSDSSDSSAAEAFEEKDVKRGKQPDDPSRWPRLVEGAVKGRTFEGVGKPRLLFAAKSMGRLRPATVYELEGDLAIEVACPLRRFKLIVHGITEDPGCTRVVVKDIVECCTDPPETIKPTRINFATAKFVRHEKHRVKVSIARKLMSPLKESGIAEHDQDEASAQDIEREVGMLYEKQPYNALALACRNLTAPTEFFARASLAGPKAARLISPDAGAWDILKGFADEDDPGDLAICNSLRAVLFSNKLEPDRLRRLYENCNIEKSAERAMTVELVAAAADLIHRIERVPVGDVVREPTPMTWPQPACLMVNSMDEYVVVEEGGRHVAFSAKTAQIRSDREEAFAIAGSVRIVRAETDTDHQSKHGYIALLRKAAQDAKGRLCVVVMSQDRAEQIRYLVAGARCLRMNPSMFTDPTYWDKYTHVWIDRAHDLNPDTARSTVSALCATKRHITIAGSLSVQLPGKANPFREVYDASDTRRRETVTSALPMHIVIDELPDFSVGLQNNPCVVSAQASDVLPPVFEKIRRCSISDFKNHVEIPPARVYILLVDPQRWTRGELARVWNFIARADNHKIFFANPEWKQLVN